MEAAQIGTNNYVPSSDLIQEEECDTLLLHLPGFKKEELRVQLNKSGVLNISGKRPVGYNKWSSFEKIFNVSSNCDKSKISAKFENDTLYVKQPKLIVPAPRITTDKPSADREEGKGKKTNTTTNGDDQVKQNKSSIESDDAKKDENNSLHEAAFRKLGDKRENVSRNNTDSELVNKWTKENAAKLKMALAILLAFALGMYVSGFIL
ncbi:hypothetical protein ACJIZ3_017447 [Penstemon smallii]|uniref:SHSP domain-containing protein n=1 Tax=Penstemon smallii TaxID=265156 RepID=A0ABD3SW06_9LAMI